MGKLKNSIISWNVDGLGDRNRKHLVRNWIRTLPSCPTIMGLQEIKTSTFFTLVALNVILLDYPRIIFSQTMGNVALPYCTIPHSFSATLVPSLLVGRPGLN